jgi:CRP-like cAMP-binding protein
MVPIYETGPVVSSTVVTVDPRRPLNHSLVRALRRVPAFAAIDDRLLLKVVGASANLFWSAGSVIFDAGSPSEALYVVLAGRVTIRNETGESDVAEIATGEYFGEISLLRNSRHTRSAHALEDCEVLVLPKRSFEALMESNADLADEVRSRGADRLGERQLS